jgi:nucleoid DNA-binding protein
MNQKELTISISKRFFLTQVESQEVIKFILAEITKCLKKGKRISLRGFGSFTKEKRSSKKVRHPETGKIITIPERTTVDFNPSQELLKNLR